MPVQEPPPAKAHAWERVLDNETRVRIRLMPAWYRLQRLVDNQAVSRRLAPCMVPPEPLLLLSDPSFRPTYT